MEEVIGSIPIRSTNKPNNLAAPSFQLGVILLSNFQNAQWKRV
jgi:hypothetical protein